MAEANHRTLYLAQTVLAIVAESRVQQELPRTKEEQRRRAHLRSAWKSTKSVRCEQARQREQHQAPEAQPGVRKPLLRTTQPAAIGSWSARAVATTQAPAAGQEDAELATPLEPRCAEQQPPQRRQLEHTDPVTNSEIREQRLVSGGTRGRRDWSALGQRTRGSRYGI
jgi:hypothetical protein